MPVPRAKAAHGGLADAQQPTRSFPISIHPDEAQTRSRSILLTADRRWRPPFGRQVHLGDRPPRLQPGTSSRALRIPPHGGRVGPGNFTPSRSQIGAVEVTV